MTAEPIAGAGLPDTETRISVQGLKRLSLGGSAAQVDIGGNIPNDGRGFQQQWLNLLSADSNSFAKSQDVGRDSPNSSVGSSSPGASSAANSSIVLGNGHFAEPYAAQPVVMVEGVAASRQSKNDFTTAPCAPMVSFKESATERTSSISSDLERSALPANTGSAKVRASVASSRSEREAHEKPHKAKSSDGTEAAVAQVAAAVSMAAGLPQTGCAVTINLKTRGVTDLGAELSADTIITRSENSKGDAGRLISNSAASNGNDSSAWLTKGEADHFQHSFVDVGQTGAIDVASDPRHAANVPAIQNQSSGSSELSAMVEPEGSQGNGVIGPLTEASTESWLPASGHEHAQGVAAAHFNSNSASASIGHAVFRAGDSGQNDSGSQSLSTMHGSSLEREQIVPQSSTHKSDVIRGRSSEAASNKHPSNDGMKSAVSGSINVRTQTGQAGKASALSESHDAEPTVVTVANSSAGEVRGIGTSVGFGDIANTPSAEKASHVDPFVAMDGAHAGSTVHPSTSVTDGLKIGYRDPDLGYVELSARQQAGEIHASLNALSDSARSTLASHLGSITNWLEERKTPVDTLRVGTSGYDFSGQQMYGNQGSNSSGSERSGNGNSSIDREASASSQTRSSGASTTPIPSINNDAALRRDSWGLEKTWTCSHRISVRA